MKHLSPRHTLLAALAAAAALSIAGCGGAPASPSSAPVPATTTTAPTVTTTTAPPLGVNPLTGVADMTTDNDRPIGFVVTDESASLTQLNLESADMYFESETEGGIPRILAIYSSVDRIPDVIGPVRSARPHFVKFAKSLDCIYCHIGGSASGLKTIRELGVQDLNNQYEINSILKASSNFSWNRSAFVKSKVLPAIREKKYATTARGSVTPFAFGSRAGDRPAGTVVVQISGNYDMAFTYDAASGLYQKHRNALNTPVHVTETGGTVQVSNVIVMYDHRTVDEVYQKNGNTVTRYNFDMQSGSGVLASGGTARDIRWKRTDQALQYFEADGVTPLTVARGKTFVCLASSTLQGKTEIY